MKKAKKCKAAKEYAKKQNNCDPLGSYTGVPKEEGEIPTQDADDL